MSSSYSVYDGRLTDMAIRLKRNKLNKCFVYGDCQSGKTKVTTSLINNVFEKDIKNDDEVLGYTCVFTMTDCVAGRNQFCKRIRGFDCDPIGITNNVNVDNINTIDNIDMLDFTKDVAVVSHNHKTAKKKFLTKLEIYKYNFDCYVIVIDEVDKGQDGSLYDKIAFIQEIYNITEEIMPYIKVIIITATIVNFIEGVCKIHTTSNVANVPLISQFTNGEYSEIPVKKNDNYVGADYFIDNGYFKIIEFGKPPSTMSEQKYKESVVFIQIAKLDFMYKKYAYLILSRLKEDHVRYAKEILKCGFNVSIILNSSGEKVGDYPMYYISTEKTKKIKYFNIPWAKIKKMADNGDLSVYKHRGNISFRAKTIHYDTGINSALDLSIPDIINLIRFPSHYFNDPDDPIKKKMEIKYIALKEVIEFPDDVPEDENAYVIGIGGDMYDRGNTLQNPTTDTVFTLGVQISTAKTDSTNGAKDYQRFGRINGNNKQSYVNLGTSPLFLTEEKVLKNILACKNTLDYKFNRVGNVINVLFDEDQVENTFKTYGVDNIISPNERKEHKKQAAKDVKDYTKKHPTPGDDGASGSGINDEVPKKSAKGKEKASTPSEPKRDEKIDDKYEEVRVTIDDDFIEKITGFYYQKPGKSYISVVGRILNILKNKNDPITFRELYIEMIKKNYNAKFESLVSNIKLGSSEKHYKGFWNYCETKNADWIYMPKKIKKYLK